MFTYLDGLDMFDSNSLSKKAIEYQKIIYIPYLHHTVQHFE